MSTWKEREILKAKLKAQDKAVVSSHREHRYDGMDTEDLTMYPVYGMKIKINTVKERRITHLKRNSPYLKDLKNNEGNIVQVLEVVGVTDEGKQESYLTTINSDGESK